MGEIRLLIIFLHVDCLSRVALWIGLLEEFIISAGSEPVATCSKTIVDFLVIGFGFLLGDEFNGIDGLGEEGELTSEVVVGQLHLNRKDDTY